MGCCLSQFGGMVQLGGPISFKSLFPSLHYDDVIVGFGLYQTVSVRVYPKSCKLPPTVYVTLSWTQANKVWNMESRLALMDGERNAEYKFAYKKLGERFDNACFGVYQQMEYSYLLRVGWSMNDASDKDELTLIIADCKEVFDSKFDEIVSGSFSVSDFISSVPRECHDLLVDEMRNSVWTCVLEMCNHYREYCLLCAAVDVMNILMQCVIADRGASTEEQSSIVFLDVQTYATRANKAAVFGVPDDAENNQFLASIRLNVESYLKSISDREYGKSDTIIMETIISVCDQNKWEKIFGQLLDSEFQHSSEYTLFFGTISVNVKSPVVKISEIGREMILGEYRLNPDMVSKALVPFLWDVVRPLVKAMGDKGKP